MSEASRGISRRTLVKGTAWAVPAVAVASAAPAMAKSGRGPVLDVQRACKQPGSSCANTNRPYNFVKGYTFTASIYNPSGETIYVYTSTPATPPGAYDPRFQVTSAVPFTLLRPRSRDSAADWEPCPGRVARPAGQTPLHPTPAQRQQFQPSASGHCSAGARTTGADKHPVLRRDRQRVALSPPRHAAVRQASHRRHDHLDDGAGEWRVHPTPGPTTTSDCGAARAPHRSPACAKAETTDVMGPREILPRPLVACSRG